MPSILGYNQWNPNYQDNANEVIRLHMPREHKKTNLNNI